MTRLRDEVLLRLASGEAKASTQLQLAPLIGVTPGQLSRILSNPRRRLSPEQLKRFAKFLGISNAGMLDLIRQDFELPRRRERESLGSEDLVEEFRVNRQLRVDELSDHLEELEQRIAQLNELVALTEPVDSRTTRK